MPAWAHAIEQRVRVAAAGEQGVDLSERLQRLALPVDVDELDAEPLEAVLRPHEIVLGVGERGGRDEPDPVHVGPEELSQRPPAVLEIGPP
jgi:hypothetical protein